MTVLVFIRDISPPFPRALHIEMAIISQYNFYQEAQTVNGLVASGKNSTKSTNPSVIRNRPEW